MPNVLIRDLSDEVHTRLKERAAAVGMSLQCFLARELAAVAREPSPGEWAGHVEHRLLWAGAAEGDLDRQDVVDTIEAVRREREEHFVRLFGTE